MNKFWLGDLEGDCKIHWQSWTHMAKSKFDGGMGFKHLHCFNLALLAKQGWHLISSLGSFCAQVLKVKYYPHSYFLHAKRCHAPSYLWRSLQQVVPLLFEGLCWRVSNGKSINLWSDKWIPSMNNIRPLIPRSLPLDSKVSVLIDENIGNWRVDLISNVFLPFEAHTISHLPLSRRLPEDVMFLRHTRSGLYTIKTGYHVAYQSLLRKDASSSTPHDMESLWTRLWNLNIPSKIKVFLRRLLNNLLPCAINLIAKGIRLPNICMMCRMKGDSIEHIFMHCP